MSLCSFPCSCRNSSRQGCDVALIQIEVSVILMIVMLRQFRGGRRGEFLARIDRAATSIGQRIRVHSDPLDDNFVLGPILLIGFDGLDLGEGGDALVADELAEDGIEAVEVGCLIEEEEEL